MNRTLIYTAFLLCSYNTIEGKPFDLTRNKKGVILCVTAIINFTAAGLHTHSAGADAEMTDVRSAERTGATVIRH